MFPGLGHDALIGRHHQEDQVHSRGTRQHVPDEPFVAGNIDNAEENVFPGLVLGEPEVHGDPAFLLLLQPVGIHPREGLHQSCLAMVDVPGRAQDESTHRIPR